MSQRICSIDDCDAPATRRGVCNVHYHRLKRLGALPPPTVQPSRAERFWAKVDKSGECWVWLGARKTRGYGTFWDGNRVVAAHRYSYELAKGDLTDGLVLDHRCRNTSCVNPAHLRQVTQKQNMEHMGAGPHSTSGLRGVHVCKDGYRVVVIHHGRQISGGLFQDIGAAERAAIALRNRLYTCNDLDRKAPATDVEEG